MSNPSNPTPAGFYKRLLAHNIDLIPILLLLYVSTLVLPKSNLDWLIFSLIYLTYNIAFELSKWQGTPGKHWTKIVVISERGSLSFFQSLGRNLAKVLSLILLFGGFAMILFNPQKKALHDYLAQTLVVFTEESA